MTEDCDKPLLVPSKADPLLPDELCLDHDRIASILGSLHGPTSAPKAESLFVNNHFGRVKERAKELYAFMVQELSKDHGLIIDPIGLIRLAHDMVVQEALEARQGHETYLRTRQLLQKRVPKARGVEIEINRSPMLDIDWDAAALQERDHS